MNINLYNDDCLKILPTIPDKSVDLVVIDPPYDLILGGGGHSEISQRITSVKNEIQFIGSGFDFKVLDEIDRVMKKTNIFIFCSKLQISKLLTKYENKGCNTNLLVWYKTNAIVAVNGTFRPDLEYIVNAREYGAPKLHGDVNLLSKCYISPINQKDKYLYDHPTIKPLGLIKKLIEISSYENDTVLDCFMGSGTTGVACKELNRNFIGIELEKKYYDTANNRINNITSEENGLFD